MIFHIFILGLAFASAMSKRIDVQDFFPETKKNASLLTWDHAVNDQKLLNLSLANSHHMIEADVILGNLTGSPTLDNVLMGHPPQVTSQLTLKKFMSDVAKHNAGSARNKKGVKLDFKNDVAFDLAYRHLLTAKERKLNKEFSEFPLWINGDISKGPGNPTGSTVDLQPRNVNKTEFGRSVTWSVGWTTGDFQKNNKSANYTDGQIDALTKQVKGFASLTFPVRAMYAARSIPQMKRLLQNGTLTIWSGVQDDKFVDVEKLVALIDGNSKKVFVDVPDKLQERIRKARNSASTLSIYYPLIAIILALVYHFF